MAIEIKKCACGCVCQMDGSEVVKMHGGDKNCHHIFSKCETKSKTFDFYCFVCREFFQEEPKHICPRCGLIGTIRSRIAASKAEELTVCEQAKIFADKVAPIIIIPR